ncbi:uncharacterized protein L969DRAFT_48412 [Mixia osmundae IAM 14324]|uniref:Protein SYM1 n=1 Tax=Mixia osmundae (strain CBS 9802 / IAM 14324 / JCM 22182 / KY 12970) TaxID=764103 RepID=G7E9W5_MIXOS|nr:uncharacterized protein L969DRAFT_48412 [Mixia osmundae IAM 14324]KEI40068.1 hypothetical protein L969DRAFT_48412 [Mixia osmundae IAM 14324]GAA99434.1 hypothetical protein E5Q_06133 [Mixia osmundae IAM 14324]
MGSLLRAYNGALARRPLTTSCASAAVLFGTGDIIAQQAIDRVGSQHDFPRTARLTIYGGGIFAPICFNWLKWLNAVNVGGKASTVVARVALDQTVFSSANLAIFFSSTTLMAGGSLADAKSKLASSWWPTLQRNWMVWVPVQAANFSLVPPHLRLLTVNVVSLLWNTYLSLASSGESQRLAPALKDVEKSTGSGVRTL